MAKRQPVGLTVVEAKRWLRSFLVRRRQTITLRTRHQGGRTILGRLKKLKEFRRAKTVAAFISFASEVATDGLIETAHQLGKQVVVPIASHKFRRPYFVLFRPGDRMKKSPFGPMEIVEKKDSFDFAKIDLVIVPGLGFDRLGHRLGYGGGVYDRLLEKTPRAKHIGVFFSTQEVFALPREPHDRPVFAVLTEKETIRFHR